VLTPPLPVVLPLVAALLLAAINNWAPKWLANALALLTSAGVCYVAISMLVYTRDDSMVVYRLGGWAPHGNMPFEIGFVIDQTGATLVLLASLLVTAGLVYASHYFDTQGTYFHALMLTFLAGANGASQTGELFNLFIFLELMGAAAYLLCRYKSDEPRPFRGARNLAICSTIGGLLVLLGIAMLFGRTGSLNLAQIGRTLGTSSDALVLTAFVLMMSGFLIKTAVVPFHFWFADAQSVARVPANVLLSGVMVELGLYAIIRVYWAVFSGALEPHQEGLRHILAGFGAATALLGAVLCYSQRYLKRLLAFATISHMGILLLGIALLTTEGLAGVLIYAAGHSLAMASLFFAAGILLHRTGTLDEIELTARPRHLRWTGGLFFLGAAALAGLPPFGTFWGGVMISGSAYRLGLHWLNGVTFLAAAITSGAVLRFTSRAFLRWGPPAEEFATPGSRIQDKPETRGGRSHTPAPMFGTAAALVILGALFGLSPRLTGTAEAAAIHVQDRAAYAQVVLDMQASYPPTVHDLPATASDILWSLGTAVTAALLAAVTLLSAPVRRAFGRSRAANFVVRGLQRVHSGNTRDYVALLGAGVCLFGAAAFFWMR
jgi:multicomponent Na+:H+ antiporter subunit D